MTLRGTAVFRPVARGVACFLLIGIITAAFVIPLLGEDPPPSIRELREAGRFADAIPLARAQVEERRRVLGGSHWRTKDAERVLSALERIAVLPPAAQAELAEVDRLAGSLGGTFRAGKIEESIASLERQIEIRRRYWPEDDFAIASARLRLGHFIHVGRHDIRGALPILERATADLARALGDHPYTATGWCYQGWARKDAGDLRAAEPHYREAQRILEALGDEVGSAGWALRNNLATYLREIGDLDGAERLYRELEAEIRADGRDHSDTLAILSRNLAVTLTARGEHTEAAALLARSIEERRRRFSDGHPRIARETLAWLEARLDAGRDDGVLPRPEVEVAGAAREEIVAIEETLGAVHKCLEEFRDPDAPLAAIGLDELAFTLGRRDQSLERLGRTVASARRTGGASAVEVMTRAARLHLAAGRIESSRALASEAWTILEETRGAYFADPLERARFSARLRRHDPSALLARAALIADDPAAALTALEAGRGHVLLELSALAISAREEFRGDGVDGEAEGEPAGAGSSPRSRSHLEGLRARRHTLGSERLGLEKELARLFRGRNLSAEARARAHEIRERLERIDAAQRVLEREWAQWRASRAPTITPWDARRIRAALAPGELLVITRCAATDGLILCATADAVEGWPLALAFHERALALAAVGMADGAFPRQVHGALHELLPEALRARLAEARTIGWIPDGPLERLPAEVILPAGNLVPIEWGPSVTTWLGARSAPQVERASEGEARLALVAVGDPEFVAAEGSREASSQNGLAQIDRTLLRAGLLGELVPLPGTRREARAIAGRVEAASERSGEAAATRLLLGSEATEARLRRETRGPRFLHLATHGVPRSGNSVLESALALTPGAESRPDDDGALTLGELLLDWPGRLDGTDLVVLSACATARGRAEEGEGTLALPWGFLCAGARSVVATLWPVDDLATTLVMDRFYENLLGLHTETRTVGTVAFAAGSLVPRAAALAEAKEWLRTLPASEARRLLSLEEEEWTALSRRTRGIRKGRVAAGTTATVTEATPFSEPRTWAAFILIGDGR